MEFVKAIKIRNRICETMKKQAVPEYCIVCPLSAAKNGKGNPCGDFINKYPELAEPIFEQWDKEHSAMTRADKLREMFPNVRNLENENVPTVCPQEIDVNYHCRYDDDEKEDGEIYCRNCRRKFWTAEYEEPQK